jgi:DNA replication initiation complex subunit (GINS family)
MRKELYEKIKKYQSELSNNLNNQKDQQQDIENQQKKLEGLILKRKG